MDMINGLGPTGSICISQSYSSSYCIVLELKLSEKNGVRFRVFEIC